MSTHILQSSKAAYTSEAAPTVSFYDTPTLKVDAGGADEKYSYVWFPNPFARYGDEASSCTVVFYLAGDWSGTVTLTAKRITQAWKQKTVKWGVSGAKPTVSATNAGTVSVVNGTIGDRIVMDLTAMMVDVAAGNAWHGIRLESDTAPTLKLVSPDGPVARRPRMEISLTSPPDAPDQLAPDDVYIDSEYPVFRWEFNSSDDDAFQGESRIEVTTTESDYTSPVYDSGWVANTFTTFDTATAETPPAFAVDEFWWRVTVRDQNGLESDPSEEATFVREPLEEVSISDPGVDDDDVTTGTPTITVLSEFLADAVRWRLLDADDVVLYQRPWSIEDGEAYPDEESYVYQWTVPSNVPTRTGDGDPLISEPNATYKIQVDMRDEFARPGADVATDTRTFQYVPAWADTASTALAVAAPGSQPWIDLTWSRGTTPDEWLIERDGARLARMTGSDLSTGGTGYAFKDYRAVPGVTHSYKIRAKNDADGESITVQTITGATNPVAVWLIYEGDGETALQGDALVVPMLGNESIPVALSEVAESFAPINRRDSVRIVSRIGGYDGQVSGALSRWGAYTVDTLLDRLETIFGMHSTERLRLVFGKRNIGVNVGSLTADQEPTMGGTEAIHDVSFAFWQVSGFTVDVA
jgi:hypothetical protein